MKFRGREWNIYFVRLLLFTFLWNIFFSNSLIKIQNIQSLELFYDIIFFIYFCLSFFLSNLNLILWKFNEWLSSGLFKYSIYLLRFIPIIYEIIKLSRAFVFKYLTRDIFWNSYTLFSFRVVGSFKN